MEKLDISQKRIVFDSGNDPRIATIDLIEVPATARVAGGRKTLIALTLTSDQAEDLKDAIDDAFPDL